VSEERIIPTGWTEGGWRWYVVSVARLASFLIEQRGETPTPESIRNLVLVAKKNLFIWDRFRRDVSKMRSLEQNTASLDEILEKYSKIDEDESQNCAYLDDLLLPPNSAFGF
jgi:hypothetical protein